MKTIQDIKVKSNKEIRITEKDQKWKINLEMKNLHCETKTSDVNLINRLKDMEKRISSVGNKVEEEMDS